MNNATQSRRQFFGKTALSSISVLLTAGSLLAKIFAMPAGDMENDFVYQYSTVSVRHVAEVKGWFDGLRKDKKLGLNKKFQSYIGFEFDPEKILKKARSIIIMSRKHGLASVTFRHQNRDIVILIPSGYWDEGFSIDQGKALLRKDVFKGKEVALECSKLPFKTMAVRSGLAEYGLNNISFVKEYGSYHELMGFYTDQELEDHWGPYKTMRFCKGCTICKSACPTQCIRDEEFVVNIDRCLTLYNELQDPFPDWLDKKVHHSMVGCMKCQWDCPANAQNKQIKNLAVLNEEETGLILNQSKNEKIQKQIVNKLGKQFPYVNDFGYFLRNTSMALNNLIKS